MLGGGLALIGTGCLLMTLVDAGSNWRVLVAGLAVLGAGVGMANPTLASAAFAAVPRERSGMASGAGNTAPQIGVAGVLGNGYAAGLDGVFLACGVAALAGAVLVPVLVRAVPPNVASGARPAEAAAAH